MVLDIQAVRQASPIQDLVAFYSGRPLYRTTSPNRLRHHCAFSSHSPDDNPSAEVDTRKQVCYCFVCDKGGDVFTLIRERRGCSFRDAVAWLAEHRWSIPHASVVPLSRTGAGSRKTSKASDSGRWALYRYRDANGSERYQILRTPNKQFLFRHLSPDGEWIWNGDGVPRLVYQLYAIQRLPFAFIPEGEKDCDTLWAQGLPAVTNPGGAGKWHDRYTRQLTAAGVRHVCILPDNDEPGRKHARMVAQSCRAFDLQTRVLRLPNLRLKGDVTDWFVAGHSRLELLRLLRVPA